MSVEKRPDVPSSTVDISKLGLSDQQLAMLKEMQHPEGLSRYHRRLIGNSVLVLAFGAAAIAATCEAFKP